MVPGMMPNPPLLGTDFATWWHAGQK